MEELIKKIQNMDAAQVGDAVKNLRLSLQYNWKHVVSDEEVKGSLQNIQEGGDAELLRKAIVSESEDPEVMQRWGTGLLLYCASDPELMPFVVQAVDDTLETTTKDFGLSALIILGVVLVLLKYRPSELNVKKGNVKINWKENDVKVVSDLAKIVSPFSGDKSSNNKTD